MLCISPATAPQFPLIWSARASLRRVRPKKIFRRHTTVLPSSSLAPAVSQKPYIIVVDDEPAVAETVCAILEDADIRANACTFSPDAFSSIESNQPDIVILDVQMPEVDGVELFQQLQNSPNTKAIPVIFLSADATTLLPHMPDFNALGVRLLRKPFTGDELLTMVTSILQYGM